MCIRILIVDDEPGVLYTLRAVFEEEGGFVVDAASSGHDALEVMERQMPDLVITDLAMPGLDGMALLREIRARTPQLPVLMITAHGTERKAVEAMKEGAWDYLTKPFDIDELLLSVEAVVERYQLRRENGQLQAQITLSRPILYRSASMKRLMTLTHRAAQREVTVLIQGETGTGKELIAAALHELSPRRHGPLVCFNAAALPEGVAENELFGHEKGAYTGAERAHKGYFEQAHNGTLFLDEIGDLSMPLQAKLLRVLQEGEIQPLGSAQRRPIDARLVAATHRDLREEVEAGRFREDLFYRLNVIALRLPPLRERPEDIGLLLQHFAALYKKRFGLEQLQIAPQVLEHLSGRPWPGNVRQLENAIERLLALSDGRFVSMEDLAVLEQAPSTPALEKGPLRRRVEAFEASIISQALERNEGNRSATARELQISRVTLLQKMSKYGLR